MTRKVVGALIVVVAVAGISVAVLVTVANVEDHYVATQAGPIRSLEVDVEAGRVEVVAAAANEARIDGTRRYIRGVPSARETLVDGVLRIRAECRRFVAVGCERDYRVEVPAAVAVRVRTDRGPVVVADMVGMVDVDAAAGGIRLTRTRGPVRARTSAGNIDGADLVAGSLDASTDAGRIRISLAEPSPRVDLGTDAGNIDLALPVAPGGYRVATETGAGKVDVSVVEDPTSGRAVTARTGAGNIRIHPR